MNMTRRLGLAAILLPGLSAPGGEPPTFEHQVRPILKAYCLDCHGGGDKLDGKLDLRLRRTAASGGESGPAIVAGKPEESLLLERIRDGEMPPGEKKVPPDQVAAIAAWIASGAATLRDEPESLPPGIGITPEDRAFWAFQPIRRPEPPRFGPEDRVRTPIDAFLLAGLRERGFSFAPEADRATLIRRAAADLTGLAPTWAEVQAFVADGSPDAYERMIDRLLDSPAYGERWGRHWLDVAGYADSEGNGSDDTPRPYAYKYRDYVVRSFNADKPLDRFIIEQLAGDELVPRPWANLTPEQAETLAATGFLRMVVDGTATGGGDEPLAANQVVADALKVVGSSLLGLTVGCAQCHDHKYDPIPQEDYFRLRAVFEPALDPMHWRRPVQRLVSLYSDEERARAAAIEAEAAEMMKEVRAKTRRLVDAAFEKELAKFPEDKRPALREARETPADKRTAEQKALLAANPSANLSPGVLYQYDPEAAKELEKDREKVAAKRAEKPAEDFVSVLDEVPGVVPETRLFHRGDHRQPKDPVGPGDLTIVAPEGQRFEIAPKDPTLPTSGRRLAYARHLVDGRHPLVGRVLANRIWMHHFGRGLVESAGDLGALGGRPTHPALLDWLADELVRLGWSPKRMHRLIMTSTAYRQSSRRDPKLDAVDAGNTLVGRYPVRRLDAESVRDRMLAAGGRLDRTAGGPPVKVAEDAVGQVAAAGDSARRGLYVEVRRTRPDSLLAAFDLPAMAVNCDRRMPSTSAPQSLMLMNGDFALGQAKAMAARLIAETPADLPLDTTPPTIPEPASAWQYGFGRYDEGSRRVVAFAPLPHWTGSAWQGGPALPDPGIGWVVLYAAGGHPGNDADHAAIRRWVAPRDGTVEVAGRIKHAGASGDGVRGRIVSARGGEHGAWQARAGEAATAASGIEVREGDTLDFVVDCVGDCNADSYEWPIKITYAGPPSGRRTAWDAPAEFRGPTVGASLPQMIAHAWTLAYQRPISPDELDLAGSFVADALDAPGEGDRAAALARLCQQLLSSNEFLYVD
ncbi:PSD1 and planctomycete cytochrome C domain-containing protein [Tundrisphaera sp. TA3]|uniref:PSD1 and planctomycete cytochrome C domain-containing protein n=1 Tax=Tundrisphaera sp. TA3 TaxID=3435775 RepID=UPI003EBCCA38